MKRLTTHILGFLVLTAMSVTGVQAGGYSYDIGVKASALGGAFRATADDWTAVAYNPAGLAYVLDNQLGLAAGFGQNRYTYNTNFTYGTNFETGYANNQDIPNRHEITFTPEGGIILRTPLWGETTFGLSIHQTYDADVDWTLFKGVEGYSDFDFSSLGNQFSLDMDIVNFQVTAGREFVEDKLALGLGLAIVRGDLIHRSITLRDNPLSSIDPLYVVRPFEKIPEYTQQNGFGWSVGANLGLLWKANEKLNVAATFTPKTTITISGRTQFQFFFPQDDNLAQSNSFLPGTDEYLLTTGFLLETAADFEVDIVAPTKFAGGLAYDVSEKLTVSVDGEYTLWSQFKGFSFTYDKSSYDTLNVTAQTPPQLLIDLAQTDLNFPAIWDDAGRIMLGLSYLYKPGVTFLGGFSADQTATSDDTSVPHLVDNGLKYTGSLGFSVSINRWDLQFVGAYTSQEDRIVESPADFNSDGLVDNLPALVSAESFKTAFSFAYRF